MIRTHRQLAPLMSDSVDACMRLRTANVPVAMYRDHLKPLLLQVLVVAVLERPQGGRDAVTTRVAHFAPLLRTLSHDDFGDMVLPALQANAKKVRPQLSCSPLRLLFCDPPQMLCLPQTSAPSLDLLAAVLSLLSLDLGRYADAFVEVIIAGCRGARDEVWAGSRRRVVPHVCFLSHSRRHHHHHWSSPLFLVQEREAAPTAMSGLVSKVSEASVVAATISSVANVLAGKSGVVPVWQHRRALVQCLAAIEAASKAVDSSALTAAMTTAIDALRRLCEKEVLGVCAPVTPCRVVHKRVVVTHAPLLCYVADQRHMP